MFYERDYQEVVISSEILASADFNAFTQTVRPDNVTADAYGKKIVKRGCFIDANGDVATIEESEGSFAFTTAPIGVLFEDADVTFGNAAVSVIERGFLKGNKLYYGEGVDYDADIKEAVETALPHIILK